MSSGIYNKYTVYHNRKSIRLRGYDYSRPGYYFVTVCAQHRECFFGKFSGGGGAHARGELVLHDAGRMVQTVWNEIPLFYAGIDIDEFIIMPNHIHGIIVIRKSRAGTIPGIVPGTGLGTVGADPRVCPDFPSNGQPAPSNGQPRGVAPSLSLPDIVHRLKTMTTKRYADGVNKNQWQRFPGKLWQRNYYERIIRDEKSLYFIRKYIRENPSHWRDDAAHHVNNEIEKFEMVEVRDDT